MKFFLGEVDGLIAQSRARRASAAVCAAAKGESMRLMISALPESA